MIPTNIRLANDKWISFDSQCHLLADNVSVCTELESDQEQEQK